VHAASIGVRKASAKQFWRIALVDRTVFIGKPKNETAASETKATAG
jgi:hypothetical protein